MLTSSELEYVVEPLLNRSACMGNTAGFCDYAATCALERLGVDVERWENRHANSQKLSITRWFDSKVKTFMDENHKGQGIEVNGGLSTRFHRISKQSDWPRFSWQIINRPLADDCFKQVFQEQDNFRSVPCECPTNSWIKATGWLKPDAVIVILGEDLALTPEQITLTLLPKLLSFCNQGILQAEFLIRHTHSSLAPIIQENVSDARVIEEITEVAPTSFYDRIMNRFTSNKNSAQAIISHLKFDFKQAIYKRADTSNVHPIRLS